MIPSPEISYNFLRCRGPGLIYDWKIYDFRMNLIDLRFSIFQYFTRRSSISQFNRNSKIVQS